MSIPLFSGFTCFFLVRLNWLLMLAIFFMVRAVWKSTYHDYHVKIFLCTQPKYCALHDYLPASLFWLMLSTYILSTLGELWIYYWIFMSFLLQSFSVGILSYTMIWLVTLLHTLITILLGSRDHFETCIHYFC